MNDWSTEFPIEAGITYLNHAAVAPWPLRTARAVHQFADENLYRGSQGYPRWQAVEQELRERLRWLINAPSVDDIALLKSTSEGLSIVAHGLAWERGDNIVVPAEEFPSNRIVWDSLARYGVVVKYADLRAQENPEDALWAQVDAHTRLISVSAVQYASGLVMDVEELGRRCRGRGVLLCVDAIQAIGAQAFDVQAIGADFVVADGHKWMLGAEGLALFYSTPAARERLELLQFGWHMIEQLGDFERTDWQPAQSARRFECGSPNMIGIHALHASLSIFTEFGLDNISRKIINNSSYLIDKINKNPKFSLLTSAQPGRYAGIVTFRHRQIESTDLYRHLMAHGVMCAARGGGLRFSPHFYITHEALDHALELAAGPI